MPDEYYIQATPTPDWYVLKKKAPPPDHWHIIANGTLASLEGLELCLEAGDIRIADMPAAPSQPMDRVELGRHMSEAIEKVFAANGDDRKTRLFIAEFVTGYCGATYGLHIPE